MFEALISEGEQPGAVEGLPEGEDGGDIMEGEDIEGVEGDGKDGDDSHAIEGGPAADNSEKGAQRMSTRFALKVLR